MLRTPGYTGLAPQHVFSSISYLNCDLEVQGVEMVGRDERE